MNACGSAHWRRCLDSIAFNCCGVFKHRRAVACNELWKAAHGRISRIRTHLAAVTGARIRSGAISESRYRLQGFARCAVCGGLCVMMRSHSRPGERVGFYGCLAHHKRGSVASACGNDAV